MKDNLRYRTHRRAGQTPPRLTQLNNSSTVERSTKNAYRSVKQKPQAPTSDNAKPLPATASKIPLPRNDGGDGVMRRYPAPSPGAQRRGELSMDTHQLAYCYLESILARMLDHNVDDIRSMEEQVLAVDLDDSYQLSWLAGKPVGGCACTDVGGCK